MPRPAPTSAALLAALLALLALPACAPNPFSELADQGLTDMLGQAEVADATTEDGVTTHTFDPASGPMCIRGSEYRVATRPTDSNDLLIFLQGGGACWSEFCLAIENASEGMPSFGILDPTLDANPVRDWDAVYLPYCDGSLFAGDVDIPAEGDERARYHHGLANLSAALDVAVAEFPNPDRVLLAGSSGGGFGTILATPLLRTVYPRADLYVFNDSGVGVARGEDEPDFVLDLIEEWNAGRALPASCPDCTARGHLTGYLDWQLEQDESIKLAGFSSYGDSIIASTFLRMDADDFEDALKEELGWLHGRHPDRYKMFLVEGTSHTALLGSVRGVLELPEGEDSPLKDIVQLGGLEETEVDGVTVGAWLGAMLEDSPEWVVVQE